MDFHSNNGSDYYSRMSQHQIDVPQSGHNSVETTSKNEEDNWFFSLFGYFKIYQTKASALDFLLFKKEL